VGDNSADATAAVSGGADGGFSFPTAIDLDGSAWDRLVASNVAPQDLAELIELLEVNPTVRSTALMFALSRSRELLEQVPSTSPLQATVAVPAADLLVLVRAAMARLR